MSSLKELELGQHPLPEDGALLHSIPNKLPKQCYDPIQALSESQVSVLVY